jgi:hypothetical protein
MTGDNPFTPQTNVRQSRPVFVYKVPHALSEGIKTIGISQLTGDDELMAAKRANSDPVQLAYEQVKQSIVEVDGKPVNLADGSIDMAWKTMDPKVRSLLMAAYAKLHTPKESEIEDFLSSQEIRVA